MNLKIHIENLNLDGVDRHQWPSVRHGLEAELRKLAERDPVEFNEHSNIRLNELQIDLTKQDLSSPRQAGRKLARRLYRSATKDKRRATGNRNDINTQRQRNDTHAN